MEHGMTRRVETTPPSLLRQKIFWAWAGGVLSVSIVFAFQSLYSSLIGPISNVLPAVCAALASTSSFFCLKRYGFSVRKTFEAVWLFFFTGTLLWTLAEVTWAYYYFGLGVSVPYPSIADYLYIGGYLPMIVGLFSYLITFRVALSKKRAAIAAIMISGAAALAFGLVVPVELAQGPSLAQFVTDMIYPVLDMVLVSLVVLSLAIFYEGTISKWWILMFAGGLFYFTADEYFLFQIASGSYYNGSLDDLLFLIGYLAFALAFYVHSREV